MYRTLYLLLILYSACTLPEEKKENLISKKSDTIIFQTNDTNTAAIDTSSPIQLPAVKKIKSPKGIYQTTLLLNKTRVEHTIAFNNDFTFQLQEKYTGDKKDSIVVAEGTWTPSDGFIWLYKDQIERGRYKWKGETLQYYSPLFKKSFSMEHLQDAEQNATWQKKSKQGIRAFGVGNEPFWNVEINNNDSLSFFVSEWSQPLKMKLNSSFDNSDSSGYIAKNDSAEIHVTIFPRFCSDGMSDLIYRNKIRVQYNRHMYNGCGIVYRK